MDTSSNTNAGSTAVSVVDYLLASTKQKIVTTSLTPEMWVEIIRRLLDECKPYLKYFHGFREIEHLIIGKDFYSKSQFASKGKRLILAEGITGKTRVISITGYTDGLHNTWSRDDDFLTEELCVSDKGEVILCTKNSRHEKGYEEGPDAVMYRCEMTEVDDNGLADFIRKSHGRIIDLIEALKKVLEYGILRRREQLDKLEGVLSTVDRLEELITLRVNCSKCGKSKERFGSCPHCGSSGPLKAWIQ